MALITVPPLDFRIENGAPLTAFQGDRNLKRLRDAINALAALMSISLNPDGTLRYPPIVGGTTSTGTDSYAITPTTVITSYADLLNRFVVFEADVANTGAATMSVSGLAATPIKKFGDQELTDSDIRVGQMVVLIYDGTNFQMVSWPGVVQPQNFALDTGSTNTYVVSAGGIAHIPNPLYIGYTIKVKIANVNSGASTLQIGTNTPVAIKKNGASALVGGELTVGLVSEFTYDGANFQLTSPPNESAFPSMTALPLTALPAGVGTVDIPHGITGGTPSSWHVRLYCEVSEYGYAVGDEVDYQGFFYDDTNVSCWAGATNISVRFSGNNPLKILNRLADNNGNVTRASWKIKVYVRK